MRRKKPKYGQQNCITQILMSFLEFSEQFTADKIVALRTNSWGTASAWPPWSQSGRPAWTASKKSPGTAWQTNPPHQIHLPISPNSPWRKWRRLRWCEVRLLDVQRKSIDHRRANATAPTGSKYSRMIPAPAGNFADVTVWLFGLFSWPFPLYTPVRPRENAHPPIKGQAKQSINNVNQSINQSIGLWFNPTWVAINQSTENKYMPTRASNWKILLPPINRLSQSACWGNAWRYARFPLPHRRRVRLPWHSPSFAPAQKTEWKNWYRYWRRAIILRACRPRPPTDRPSTPTACHNSSDHPSWKSYTKSDLNNTWKLESEKKIGSPRLPSFSP